MITMFRRWALSACLLSAAIPVWAEPPAPDPDENYARAEAALTAGNPSLAVELAKSALAQNPKDFRSLFLLSLAYSETGRHDEAARVAKKAYYAAKNDTERLQAARIAGLAHYSASQFTRAEWWLRRAANHTVTDAETNLVKEEFAAIRKANPLTAQFSFAVAPSSNINGGSEERFFTLGNILFIFSPSSLALSGVEYSSDAQLTYRLSQSRTQITDASLYLYGRTYSLSSSSKATVPYVSGSDYALALAEVSLRHRRMLFDGLGPTGISLHTGQVWYGGDPLWRYNKLALWQDFPIGQNASATIRTYVEDQEALDRTQSDTVVYDLQGIYARRLANNDILQLGLEYRLNDAEIDTYNFTDYRASVSYSLDKPVLGTRLSLSFKAGHKNYDEFSLSLDGRRDTYATIGATAVFDRISYFGFSPEISVSATRTKSNVTRYSTTEVQGSIGIQSNF